MKFAFKKSPDSRHLTALFFFGSHLCISNSIRIWCRDQFLVRQNLKQISSESGNFQVCWKLCSGSNRQLHLFGCRSRKSSNHYFRHSFFEEEHNSPFFPSKQQPLTTKNDFRASKLSL